MTKKELIDNYAGKVENLTKKDAALMIETLCEVITEALVAGEEVTLPGIGKFVVRDVAAKEARNPFSGETINVPAHRKAAFKVSSTLKEAVR